MVELSRDRIRELCALAIRQARKSVREDDRPHPLVGAVLTTGDGTLVAESFRGEIPKQHAEYTLFQKARDAGVDTRKCILFVTLEPCSQRGVGKTPCAIRVAQSGVSKVYIGTLDPDPRITGRGEMYLFYQGIAVEHFDSALAAELRVANREFFSRFRAAHFWEDPVTSLYGGTDSVPAEPRPSPARSREGMLHQSLDLLSASTGPIWVAAGDLSWLRELQVGLLGAALDRRQLRLIQKTKLGRTDLSSVAAHLGFAVKRASSSGRKVFTLVGAGTQQSAAIFIEKSGGLLLRTPEDSGLLRIVTEWYMKEWSETSDALTRDLQIRGIDLEAVLDSLHRHVPQYRNCNISLQTVEIDRLRPATLALERFKLFRINQLAALAVTHGVPDFAEVVGSPWPLIRPPIVERLPDNSLVLIDGTHRAYSARARGESTIDVILVENSNYDLPSQPAASWSGVQILESKLPRERRYTNFDAALFRPIRKAYEALCPMPSPEDAS